MWIMVGQNVRVVRALGALKKTSLGKTGEVMRFTTPHGYAVIRTDDGDELMVHPEALDQV